MQESLRIDVPDKSLTNVHKLNCQEGLQKDLHGVSSANGQAQIIQENLLKDVPEMVFRHHRPQFKPENFDLTTKFNISKESVEDTCRTACDLLDGPNSSRK